MKISSMLCNVSLMVFNLGGYHCILKDSISLHVETVIFHGTIEII